jgi:hypothetical protein
MRIESSVTSLSWIPLGAVEGFNRLSFGLRVAHYDPPPPELLGDLDELQATDRFRFANRLEAWIEVRDGRIVDAGQRGGGRVNVTKVGYGSASIAFAPIILPDLRPDPEIATGWARFVQTAGRSGRLSRPPPGPPRALHPDHGAGDLVHPRPHHPRRRQGSNRGWSVPAPFLGTGSMTTVVGWSPRVGSSTTRPGGGRPSAATRPGGPRTRPQS